MKANTDEMRNIASEINALAVEYQTLITNYFNKIAQMTDSGDWVGKRAKEYIEIVLQDKADLMSVGDRIKSFGKLITDDANLLDSKIAAIQKEEAK